MSINLNNSVSRLGSENLRFVSWLSSSGHRNSMGASLSLGRVIAARLPFCTESLGNMDDISLSFNMRNSESVYWIIDAVNELVIIDRKAVFEFAKQFWCWRHYQANMPAVCYGTDQTKRIKDFFSMGTILSDSTIKCIEESAESLPYLTSGFDTLVATITAPAQ